MYSENDVYAQNMTKASIRLPRSRRWLGRRMLAMAFVAARRVRKKVTKAKAASAELTRKVMPYIVEYHVGSSDMAQSIEQNVRVSTMTSSPPAAHLRREDRKSVV